MNVNRHRTRGGFTTKTAIRTVRRRSDDRLTLYNTSCAVGAIDEIYDVKAEYGSGVWPMRPLFRRRVSYDVMPSVMPCTNGCHGELYECTGEIYYPEPTQEAEWTDIVPGSPYHPDTVTLPADMRSELIGRAESEFPHLYRGLPVLIRSLVELRDMAKTVRSAAETLRLLIHATPMPSAALSATLRQCERENINFWRAAKAFRQRLQNGTVQVAAGDWLAWQFAIAPYIDDIRKLVKQSDKIRSTFGQLRKGLGKVHTLRVFAERSNKDDSAFGEKFTCRNGCEGCPIPANLSSYSDPFVSHKESRTAQRAVLTLKYTYTMPAWAEEMMSLGEALVSYVKAGFSKKTVFELIPFSFVLEWFLNADPLVTGDIFGRKTNPDTDCVVTIVESCLTYILEEGMTCVNTDDRGISTTEVGTGKYVYRWVGEEALNRLNWIVKLPSFMQIALGAALGASNSRPWS